MKITQISIALKTMMILYKHRDWFMADARNGWTHCYMNSFCGENTFIKESESSQLSTEYK